MMTSKPATITQGAQNTILPINPKVKGIESLHTYMYIKKKVTQKVFGKICCNFQKKRVKKYYL